ncbi:hypothetical protein Glove_33g89 [Diversispora epigaea]|uniref:Serine-threonine/tyrosine-protein kinase catalytic domain-containing protein n=1 Tax=Diversispora epigaea TaxID=1348612 RepID=A0A397JJ94_9GLOM|nr:hypothetical protein Glove_33g89 [Diversispora epigaea]
MVDLKQYIILGGFIEIFRNGILKINNGKDMVKKCTKFASIQIYGITQDPETHLYMIVLDYVKDGNL